MYNGTHTEWLRNRPPRFRVAAQVLPVASTGEIVLPAIRGIALLPSWILLAMILLSATAVCSTVILKARSELQSSVIQHNRMASEIDSIRRANNSLELEIRRLTNDPNAIELAARERLGMVMPNDIVVPIDSTNSASDLRSLPFVR